MSVTKSPLKDIYATEDKSWNIIFPLITVEGTDPELDVMSEDMNTVVGVHYLKDVAYAMGDFGYHQTRVGFISDSLLNACQLVFVDQSSFDSQ